MSGLFVAVVLIRKIRTPTQVAYPSSGLVLAITVPSMRLNEEKCLKVSETTQDLTSETILRHLGTPTNEDSNYA